MADGKQFPLSLIVKAVDRATGPLRKVSAEVGDLSKKVSAVGQKLTLGVSAPLAAIGTASVMAFGKFEAGMASVSTLVDTSVESIDAMGASVLDISRRVPVKIGDLTDALASARGAGVTAADQFKVLENSAKLGAAALGTTKEATMMAVGAINAFGLKGKEAEGVYNLLFQATNTGVMTLSELSTGFGSVAGTVASAGVKLDEYLASVAALTTTTRPASEAHTQMKAVLSGLTRQTDMTRAVFGKLGAKDIKGLIASSGGLVPALEKIKVVLKGDDGQMLKLLGSTEALAAALDLTGGSAGAFKGTLATMRSGVDGMSGAFEKQNRTGVATLQRLQNATEGVAISIGRVLVPVLEQLAPHLERAAAWWESLGSEGQKTIIGLAAGAAALGPTISVISNLATVVGATHKVMVFASGWAQYMWMMRASIMAGLVPSLKAASLATWKFTVALLANPVTWVVAGVMALAYAAYAIYENWEPIKTFFSELWAGVVSAFKAAWAIIAPIAENIVSVAAMPLKLIGQAGDYVFGTAPARPMLGAERAAPAPRGRQSEARVEVAFTNLPRGAAVRQPTGNTTPLDLNVGYSNMGP
jgi:TP901 family phage tail tape measure protein